VIEDPYIESLFLKHDKNWTFFKLVGAISFKDSPSLMTTKKHNIVTLYISTIL
jgi:hypothetical protein